MAGVVRFGAVVLLSMFLILFASNSAMSPGKPVVLPDPVVPVHGTYRSVEDVLYTLSELYEKYGVIAPLESGTSQVKGLPIPAFRIGEGPCALLIMGGIHGDEWPVVGTVLYMAERYARGLTCGQLGGAIDLSGVSPDEARLYKDIATVFQGKSIVVVPVLNPDGLGVKRWNGRGVDLNRNFDVGWNMAVGEKGDSPESEAEARFLADLTRREEPQVVMGFHCYLDCIFWTYDQEGESLRRDEKVALSVMEAYGDLLSGGLQSSSPAESTYGGYKDWFIKEFHRPGFTVETPGRDRFGSLDNMVKSDFWPRFQEASVRAGLNAVKTYLAYQDNEITSR